MSFGFNTFLFMGGHSLGVIQNNLMSLGGEQENVSDKENCPDLLNERSLYGHPGL